MAECDGNCEPGCCQATPCPDLVQDDDCELPGKCRRGGPTGHYHVSIVDGENVYTTYAVAVQIDPDDLNEEFFFGDIAVGVLDPWCGLFFCVDWHAPDPGFMIVIGPFKLWARRHWGIHLGRYFGP